ncbi:MAG: chemotaxis-specific protein-glutamate methyltransferase CheB [bacterium]|nr:chemotaxis-specific protein-glutamate methyltransferase CheB [bacterium]
MTRVFVVDDSMVCRVALRRALECDPQIEIVGEASSGEEALQRIPESYPDIVLMDIVMSQLDGLGATRELMSSYPKPVLIISDQIGGHADRSFEALRAGALDVVGKPSADQLADGNFVAALCHKIRMLSEIPVVTRRGSGDNRVIRQRRRRSQRPLTSQLELVCLGASTGGPPALQRILNAMPSGVPWPILIVQHMTPGFTEGMVSWLRRATNHDVRLAENGERPAPGVVYVAQDEVHLELVGRRLRVLSAKPVGGHRPSVDVLFASVASTAPAAACLAVVLTGMGRDGAQGMKLLREAGAWTIAQDERSCVVYGMPKAAVDEDAACESLSLDEVAGYLSCS